MAGPFDPFSPVGAPAPTGGMSGLGEQWAAFMEQPGARAALLQAGLALMSPPGFGENAASQVGRAVGAGAEAATRQEVIGAKLRESEQKGELMEARARTAGAQAEKAQMGIGLEHFRQQAITARSDADRQARLFAGYNRYKEKIESDYKAALKQWQDSKLTAKASEVGPQPVKQEILPFDTWLAMSGMGGATGAAGPASARTGETGKIGIGHVMTGKGGKRFKFTGGNPGDAKNWEEIQ